MGSLRMRENLDTVLKGGSDSLVWNKGGSCEKYVILLSGALTGAAPMLLVPFDWDRDYLLPIFFSCIFFSIGAGQLLFIWFHIQKVK